MAHDPRKFSPRSVINAPPAQRQNILRKFWLPAVLLLALAAGGLTGIIAAYKLNYSRAANEVAALATYRPSVVTRVYADDGETVIGEFALEKRIPLKYSEIPPLVKNAILAVEDARHPTVVPRYRQWPDRSVGTRQHDSGFRAAWR